MKIPSTPSISGQGADFKIKIKKVAGYWNYDSSEFARPGTPGVMMMHWKLSGRKSILLQNWLLLISSRTMMI
jgi:hypothetical protein